MVAQDAFHGFACQLGMVVLLTDVAQPYVLQYGCCIFGKKMSGFRVAQMPDATADAPFEECGIFACHEHVAIVVRLNDEMLGTRDGFVYLGCGMSDVGKQAEDGIVQLNDVAYIVRTVVGHFEGRDAHVAKFQRDILLHIAYVLCGKLARYAIVAVDALVNFLCGIDGLAVIVRQIAYRLYVVGMVVRDEYGIYLLEGNPIVAHVLLQRAHTDARINEYGRRCRAQIVAVSATT